MAVKNVVPFSTAMENVVPFSKAMENVVPFSMAMENVVHTEKCLVGFTIRWLIQLHDLVSYKATTYLVAVTNSDSCSDLGNISI